MATKRAVVLVCWFLMVSAVFMGCCSTVADDDETWQEVLTTDGSNVVYGASSTYTIWAQDIGIGYLYHFFFGLGYTGEAVRTDTALTMGVDGNESNIYACVANALELVAVNTSGTPQNAIIRVRYNSTDSNYRLQITESSPAVYVQFTYLYLGGLLCTPGVAGTPIQFASSSSANSHDHPHEPAIIALREVVDA
ncbi:hypothetical protein L7F22_051996 [Adiantum nelumboides]|nr:hypothetical protein [Adiantum nelumboides]